MASTSNPFGYQKPVAPDRFVGRWQMVEQIVTSLESPDGESHGCIGGRRFGKSSLLGALKWRLQALRPVWGDCHVLPLYLDLMRQPFETEGAFFSTVLDELRQTLLESGMRDVLERVGRPDIFDQPKLSSSQFEDGLISTLGVLKDVQGFTRVVLLLDEADWMLRYTWREVFFGQLRSLVSFSRCADAFSLVVAGSRRFLSELNNPGSPLWNILELHFLSVLDEDAVYALAYKFPELDEKVRRAVWQQSGGHPFLAQYLLHHLWELNNYEISDEAVSALAKRFMYERQTDLNGWAAAIGPTGLQVYQVLTEQQDWFDRGMSLIRRLDQPGLSIKGALVDLCYHGFAVHDGTWNRFRWTGDLFRDWYLSEGARFGDPQSSTSARVVYKGDDMARNLHVRSDQHEHKTDDSETQAATHPAAKAPVLRDSEELTPSALSPAMGVDFVLVTALSEERDAVLTKLPGYHQLPPAKGDIRTYYWANLPVTFPDGSAGTYCVIVVCLLEKGRVQAATATGDAIRRWHPRHVVLVGIAGGIAANNIHVGDILISDQVVDYELQKLTPEGPEMRWEVYRADARLLDACKSFRGESWQELIKTKRPGRGKPNRHTGPIASGDKVIAFGDILARYQDRDVWPRLLGVEMEAGGAATAAFQSSERPGFFMLRCVSDLADESKDTIDVGKWRSYACDAAASFAIALLRSGPIPLSEEGRSDQD